MIASGRLKSSPKRRPTAQPGHGSRTQPITSPTPNRFRNAPSNAAGLSENSIGNIIPTETAPKARPVITPHSGADRRDRFDMIRLAIRRSSELHHQDFY